MVGMNHRRAAVEPLHAAADDDLFALRHRLFEIGGVRVEECQPDLAGVVMRVDAVGHRPVAARRRLVPVDAHIERDDRAFGGKCDARPVAPVDDGIGQHEQQIPARASRSPISAGTIFEIMPATSARRLPAK